MSLKRKILNFLAATVMVLGSTPFVFQNASAAENDAPVAPEHSKTISDNGDGSYTITLSVTGKSETTTTTSKANVVVIMDTSKSMDTRISNQSNTTRLDSAKSSLSTLFSQLLANNSTENPDMVEIAFISFDDDATLRSDWTANQTSLTATLNGMTTNSGTNWEAALQLALQKANTKHAAQADEEMYIIFATDGNPTCYVGGRQCPGDTTTSYNNSRDEALAITNAGYHLYNLGVYGTVSTMQNLTTYANGNSKNLATFIEAKNEAAVNAAFANIVSEITSSLSVTDIVFQDGLTSETSIAINGDAADFSYTKNGANWADAPAATYNPETKTVTWNLGDTVIANGDTVTVSFIVWPSQEVVDMVADLENGHATWEDDVVGTKYEKEVNRTLQSDGSYKYTLKTNTDYPSLTYCPITTTTVNGNSTTTKCETPTTVEITNPDPVDLTETKLTVRKVWADGLDPSQRADYHGQVVLDFYRGSEIYEENITLDEQNNWALEEYLAIAPGIMVSSSHEAYKSASSYTADGSYGILNEGHDYHFTEPDEKNMNGDEIKGKHFYLTEATYHPMLVNGTLMNVFYHYDGEGKVVIDEMEELSEITATNTVKGGALIEKKLVGNDGETELESDKQFGFHAELKTPAGEDYSYTYRIYYGENNPKYGVEDNNTITSAKGEKTYRSGKQTGTGSLDIEIYAGDKVMFTDVETGAWFYAEEDDSELGLGYSVLDETKQIVRNGSDVANNAKTKNFDGKTFYQIEGNASTQYIVTNAYYTGSLTIAKEVINTNGDANAIKDKEFTFKVEIDGQDEQTITLKAGESKTIANIPAGAGYTVSEEEMAGFTARESSKTGTIEKDTEAKAEFTNTYAVAPTTAFIRVWKGFDNFWLDGDSFTFQISGSDGAPTPTQTTVTTNNSLMPAEFKVTFEGYSADTYAYTITEPNPAIRSGISRLNDDADIVVKISLVDNGDGTLGAVKQYSKGNNTVSEENKDVVINNTYEVEPVAINGDNEVSIDIKKIVDGMTEDMTAPEMYFALTYIGTLELEDENKNQNLVLTDVAENGEYIISLEEIIFKQAGEYKFKITEEANADADEGWIFNAEDKSYTITVKITDDYEGHLVPTILDENGEEISEVEFTNIYAGRGEVEPVTPNTGKFTKASDGAQESRFYVMTIAMFIVTLGVAMHLIAIKRNA